MASAPRLLLFSPGFFPRDPCFDSLLCFSAHARSLLKKCVNLAVP
jgi:hypothetical protein